MSYTLWLDTETFSETPIKHGHHRYAETAEVILVSVAVDDDPTRVWDTSDPEPRKSQMAALQSMIDGAGTVVIHNSAFDRAALREGHGVIIPVEKIDDTMVQALQHSLPGKLETLGEIFGLSEDEAKLKDGKKLINLFCKPRPKNMKLRRATRETHPDEWQRFIEYAGRDVDAMRRIRPLIPRWNCTPRERVLWQYDQAINDRGIAVDRELAVSALRAFQRASGALAARAADLTGGAVSATTQRAKLIDYLRDEEDLVTSDLTKGTVDFLLRTENMSDTARELLQVRQQAAATTPAKYRALLDAMSSDGRLRGTVQYCGAARTGRDAGRIFQPQNLVRTPDWFDGEVQETTVAALKADCEDIIWANVSERCAFAVRGSLVAAPGKKFVIADLSNIEGRKLAWGAQEQWKIDAFKAFDRGEGHDLYKVTAGRILGKDPGDITKGERQTMGKVPELACGYQGALGAFRVMGGVVVEAMDDDTIIDIVKQWRSAHPRTKSFWYDVEAAAKRAIENPGESYSVRDVISFDLKRGPDGVDWLRMKLPVGRYLCYRNACIEIETCARCEGTGFVGFEFNGETKELKCPHCGGTGTVGSGKIAHEGTNQYTRKWETLRTYGGKLAENWDQASSRDVFMTGLIRAERAGYAVVARIHDELVCEVPDTDDYTCEALAAMMAEVPSWATGLPLAAAGFETKRYRKE